MNYPVKELYNITNQLRRAVISIPCNIAEGAGRKSPREFKQFLHIALGSASEIETLLIISLKLKYISSKENNEKNKNLKEIIIMLGSLIKSIK